MIVSIDWLKDFVDIKETPEELSEILADKVDSNAVGRYLNFKADPNWLCNEVLSGSKKEETCDVLIEHTSANPNGPFHVGRARNAILGDTLVRLNRLYGNNTRAEYYVDDMGKQVAILAWALQKLDADSAVVMVNCAKLLHHLIYNSFLFCCKQI